MDEEELEQPRKKITLSNFFDSIVSVEKVADRALKKTNVNFDIINQNKSLIAALTQSFDDLKVEIREIKEYITIERDIKKDESLSQEDREQKLRRLERTFMGGEGSEDSLNPEDKKQQEDFFKKALQNPNVLQIIAGGVLGAVSFAGGTLLSAFGIGTDSQEQSEQSGKKGGGFGGFIDFLTDDLTDFDRQGVDERTGAGKPKTYGKFFGGLVDLVTANAFDLDKSGDFVNSREDLERMKELLEERREERKQKKAMKNIMNFNLGGPVFDNDNDTTNNDEDSVPAMLTPGEFVVTKDAVDKIGVDTLKGLNASVGATNKPTKNLKGNFIISKSGNKFTKEQVVKMSRDYKALVDKERAFSQGLLKVSDFSEFELSNDEFEKKYLKGILKDIGVETRNMDIELRGGATIEDLNKIITTQNPDAEEAPRLPGLGGGGGGTNAITSKAKDRTLEGKIKNVGKILTFPLHKKRVDPNEKFASEEYVTEDDPWMNFNNGGLVEGVKKMFSSSEDEIVKNPFEVENTNTPDFALLTAVSALEGGDPQARVDVAQSVYNRYNEVQKDIADGPGTTAITDYTRDTFKSDSSGVFPKLTLSDILLRDSQYQPTYIDPTKKEGPKTAVSDEFKNVKDRKSAIVAMKSYYDKRKMPMSIKQIEELYDQTVLDLQDQKMNKSASAFVGGRTEFRSSKFFKEGDQYRGESGVDNTFFSNLGTGTQLETGAAVSPLLKSPLESDLQSNILPMIESVTNKSTQSISAAPKSSQDSNIVMLPMPMGNTQPQPVVANDPVIAPVAPPEVTTTPVASTMSTVSFINMISNKQLSIG